MSIDNVTESCWTEAVDRATNDKEPKPYNPTADLVLHHSNLVIENASTHDEHLNAWLKRYLLDGLDSDEWDGIWLNLVII